MRETKIMIVDFIAKKINEDDNDYIFVSPMIRVWHSLTGNHAKHVKHIFPRHNDKPNGELLRIIEAGENKYWTPETLSFMRGNVLGKRIISVALLPLKKILGAKFSVVDATANIGGESIQLALASSLGVEGIIAYEPNKKSFEMLCENIALYDVGDIIKPVNSIYDYHVGADLVMIDPPFQSSTNIGNFNMSIEKRNLHYVLLDIIKRAGAKVILLNAPGDYLLNAKFCTDNGLCACCYRFGKKNVKIYLIMSIENYNKMWGEDTERFITRDIFGTMKGANPFAENEADYKLMYLAAAKRLTSFE